MNKYRRVCILLMDSLGVGASLDAHQYGDEGANTFGSIVHACDNHLADHPSIRKGPLQIPNLAEKGLYHVGVASSGMKLCDLALLGQPKSVYGYAVEQSMGKDTPSGHWELAGVPVLTPWGYFPDQPNCFPDSVLQDLIQLANLPGVLGEKHASGTDIILELGKEHMESGKPIVYTSADSVFQIAAHEDSFGLDRLYRLCEIARKILDPLHIGRVIARPFVGSPGAFKRTGNRRDYAVLPPAPTLLDHLQIAQRDVIGIGKTSDIFAHQGITKSIKADGNMALFDATLDAMKSLGNGGLIFTNFVDFDSSYGHRRDVIGYAHALETFDARLPELDAILEPGDLVVITADHGCDPTREGSDHTREHVPVLMYGPGIDSQYIGRRDTFADVGQSIATYLQVAPLQHGVSIF